MPSFRMRTATDAKNSAYFHTATICSTETHWHFMAFPHPPLGIMPKNHSQISLKKGAAKKTAASHILSLAEFHGSIENLCQKFTIYNGLENEKNDNKIHF